MKNSGGIVENHYGAHAEKVAHQLSMGTTLEPDHDDQRFVAEAWAAAKFKLDVPKYLVTAAVTPEARQGHAQEGGPHRLSTDFVRHDVSCRSASELLSLLLASDDYL